MAEAKIRITAQDDATRTLNRVTAGLKSLAAPLGAITGLGGAIGLTALVAGLREIAGALDALQQSASSVGVAAKSLADMRISASQAGVSAQQLDTALAQLNRQIGQANAGNQESVRWFKALGVAFKDARGEARGTEEVLRDISRVFSTSADGAGKTALAMKGLGDAGAKMIPYLNQGADGLKTFSGLTEETIDEAKKLQREINELSNAWERFKNRVLGVAVPAANALLDSLRGGSTEQKISEIETIIAGLNQQANASSAANLAMYTEQLAKLKAQLSDEQMQRFISGANAVRRVDDGPRLGLPDVPEARAEKAVEKLGGSYKALFDDVERIRKSRAAMAREIEDEAASTQRLLEALTGRTSRGEQAQQLQLIEDAFFDARISAAEFDVAYSKIFGLETTQAIKQSVELVDQLGLSFESALSDVFRTGDFSNFFKALVTDITQVIFQMLVLKPIIESIKRSLSSVGGGFDLSSIFSFGGPKAMGGPVTAGTGYVVGEKGPEFFVPSVSGTIVPNGAMGGVTIVQNNAIDARSDIATIRQMLEANKARTLYEVGEQLARRGALARV